MALIVVGGQTKNIGKTTLICNIIAAFRQFHWTAVKITVHFHEPEGGELLAQGLGWSIWQQGSAERDSDTARFLNAGAERALLVRADEEHLEKACATLQEQFSNRNWIVESSSAATYLEADLSVLIIDPARTEFKDSARKQLASADVLVVRGMKDGDDVREIRRAFGDVAVFPALQLELDERMTSLIGKTLEHSGLDRK
jgi:hypothetical protein